MDKKIVSLEMPVKLKERLRLEAFKRNVSFSKLVRQLLEESLGMEPEVRGVDDGKFKE